MAAAIFLDVGEKGFVGLDCHHAPAMVGDVKAVLGKKRSQDDDFIAGVENRFEEYVAGTGRARGHEDIVGGEGNAVFPAQLWPPSPRAARDSLHSACSRATPDGCWQPLAATSRSPSSGGSTSGLPRVKSKTLSAPRSRLSRAPSSNMRRIHEDPLMASATVLAIGIRSPIFSSSLGLADSGRTRAPGAPRLELAS